MIDDSPLILAVGSAILEGLDCRILTSNSLRAATEILSSDAEADPPDLILLDARMPIESDENGPSMFEAARGSVPFVFYSGLESGALEELAEQRGAVGWIAKSVGPDELLAEVERLLAAHATRAPGGTDG